MLRFSLFGFPVSVHWLFWVTCALIGGGAGATSRDEVIRLLFFVVAAFISIMIHELGHAFMMRRYGARATIMLYAFGGLASPDRWFNRGQGILVSLAGPVVQIAVGLLVLFAVRSIQPPSLFLIIFLMQFVWVSIFWGVLNLIPIYPLDGGRILYNALGQRRARTTYTVGMILAAAVALLLLSWMSIFGTILFAMMAYENYQRLQGHTPSSMLNPQ